jgi:hypothetical protein
VSGPWRTQLIGLTQSVLVHGLLPFRVADPLSAAERRSVAALWGLMGSIFGCAWVSAFLLIASALGREVQVWVALALVLAAAIFFTLAGYVLVGLVNRLLRRSALPSPPPGVGNHSAPGSDSSGD